MRLEACDGCTTTNLDLTSVEVLVRGAVPKRMLAVLCDPCLRQLVELVVYVEPAGLRKVEAA